MNRVLHAAKKEECGRDGYGNIIYNVTTLCGNPGSIGENAVECRDCLAIMYGETPCIYDCDEDLQCTHPRVGAWKK